MTRNGSRLEKIKWKGLKWSYMFRNGDDNDDGNDDDDENDDDDDEQSHRVAL